MAAGQQHSFANPEEIDMLRNSLLEMEPFQDYFLHQPGPSDKPPMYVIQSVYKVNIPRLVMDLVKSNLNRGNSLTNEGFLAVSTLDDLVAGNPMTQGITGLVIGHVEGVTVPHCLEDGFTFAPIGVPRGSYTAYGDRFEYRVHSPK